MINRENNEINDQKEVKTETEEQKQQQNIDLVVKRIKEQQIKEREELIIKNAAVQKYISDVIVEHENLITNASKLSASEFCDQIYHSLPLYLYPKQQNIVGYRQVNGKSLFHVVLEHKATDSPTKIALIKHLFNNGYGSYFEKLLEKPLINILSTSDFIKFSSELIYNNFDDIRGELPLEIKIKILNYMLEAKVDQNTLLNKIISGRHTIVEQYQLVQHWMNQLNTKDEVSSLAHAIIDRLPGMMDQPVCDIKTELDSKDRPFIYKMAQLRILAIAAEKQAEVNNDEKIKQFLQSTEPCFLFNFSFFRKHDSAYDIYKMMLDNKPEANDRYAAKCQHTEDNINIKLTHDLGYETHFSLKG